MSTSKKSTKKIGRPPKHPSQIKKKVNLSLNQTVREKGDALAYARGLSLSELVEELIRKESARLRGER